MVILASYIFPLFFLFTKTGLDLRSRGNCTVIHNFIKHIKFSLFRRGDLLLNMKVYFEKRSEVIFFI